MSRLYLHARGEESHEGLLMNAINGLRRLVRSLREAWSAGEHLPPSEPALRDYPVRDRWRGRG